MRRSGRARRQEIGAEGEGAGEEGDREQGEGGARAAIKEEYEEGKKKGRMYQVAVARTQLPVLRVIQVHARTWHDGGQGLYSDKGIV